MAFTLSVALCAVADMHISAVTEASATTIEAMAHGDIDIAAVGALLSDSSRCRVLLALADGRSLSASALAAEAGVAPSTASEHLAKLVSAGLLVVDARGRNRYYRLAGASVARLLETLMQYSPRAPIRSLREGTRAHALRQARYCYDHLGGRLAVALMDLFLDQGLLTRAGQFGPAPAPGEPTPAATHDIEYRLTTDGSDWMRDFGVDLEAMQGRRRPVIRHCLDWSEQRHHLAGALGQAVADRLFSLEWVVPGRQSRVVLITESGSDQLAARFGIHLEATPAARSAVAGRSAR